jgi:hypothetical protein
VRNGRRAPQQGLSALDRANGVAHDGTIEGRSSMSPHYRAPISTASFVGALLLTGCGGGSPGALGVQSAAGSVLPQARAMQQSFAIVPASKVSGTWGVAVGDSVAAQYSNTSPMTCSTPGQSLCNGLVHKKSFPDSLTDSGTDPTSGATDSTTLTADAKLGVLTASTDATAASGFIAPSTVTWASAGDTVNIQWEDTFLVTSSTLPAGTSVTFASTLKINGKENITCNEYGNGGEVYAGIEGAGGTSGVLVSLKQCNSGKFSNSYKPVLTGTLTTTVGSTFTVYGFLEITTSAEAGVAPAPGTSTNSLSSIEAKFEFKPVTTGAAYETASGKQYAT